MSYSNSFRPTVAGLPRGLMVLLGLGSAVVVVAGMKGISGILGAAFLALVLAIAVHPLHLQLRRLMPSWLATAVCLLVVYLMIVALAVTLVASGARFANLLPQYEDRFADLVHQIVGKLSAFGISHDELSHVASSLDLSGLGTLITSAISSVFSVVSNLAFILALLLFFTVDASTFPRQMAAAGRLRPSLVRALFSFARDTRRYLLVSTVFGLIVAVFDAVALVVLGVPAPVLWGLLSFLTNYIPNIGFVAGMIPPAVLALLTGGLGLMIAVIVIYCVVNIVIQSMIQPKIVGDSVGLSTSLTFLSLVFWSWVIGPLGAVMAIPFSLLSRAILIDSDPGSSWLAPLVANHDRDVQPRNPAEDEDDD